MSTGVPGISSAAAVRLELGSELPLTLAGKLELILELTRDYDEIYDEYGNYVGRTYREPVITLEQAHRIFGGASVDTL